jgi:hypothetical protein
MTVTVEDLPPYLYCDGCSFKHFLTLNKDIQGHWSAAYIAYRGEGTTSAEDYIDDLVLNNAASLNDVAGRMHTKLEAHNRTKQA